MKYKAGDKVIVRSDMEERKRFDAFCVDEKMLPLLGKMVTIKEVDDACFQPHYHIEEDEGSGWVDGMIDHEETKKLQKEKCGKEPDAVNHPPHYTFSEIEAIEVIDAFFKNNYYLGQVFKYTSRAGHKENELQDLKKAQWYLNRYIEEKEGK